MADPVKSDADKAKEAEAAKAAAAEAKAKEAAKKKAKEDEAAAKQKSSKSYFKSRFSGLTVVKEDGTTVRFSSFWDKFQGDDVRVGYLETDDPEVVKRLQEDGEVEEVEASEFNKKTNSLRTAAVSE